MKEELGGRCPSPQTPRHFFAAASWFSSGGLRSHCLGHIPPQAVERTLVNIMTLCDVPGLLAARVINQPVDFDLLLMAGELRQLHHAVHHEIGRGGLGHQKIAGVRNLHPHLADQTGIAITGGAGDIGQENARRPVIQAVRIALLHGRIDGAQQIGDLRRRIVGHTLKYRRIAGCPLRGWHRCAADGTLRMQTGIQHFIFRDDRAALQLGGDPDLPIAGARLFRKRRQLLRHQSIRQIMRHDRGIVRRQQGGARRRNNETRGRWIGQAQRRGAGAAGEGLRQVAAGRQADR
jgi:hypothetical protein